MLYAGLFTSLPWYALMVKCAFYVMDGKAAVFFGTSAHVMLHF